MYTSLGPKGCLSIFFDTADPRSLAARGFLGYNKNGDWTVRIKLCTTGKNAGHVFFYKKRNGKGSTHCPSPYNTTNTPGWRYLSKCGVDTKVAGQWAMVAIEPEFSNNGMWLRPPPAECRLPARNRGPKPIPHRNFLTRKRETQQMKLPLPDSKEKVAATVKAPHKIPLATWEQVTYIAGLIGADKGKTHSAAFQAIAEVCGFESAQHASLNATSLDAYRTIEYLKMQKTG